MTNKRKSCAALPPFWWWLAALLGLAALAYLMLADKWRSIENDLGQHSNTLLQQQNMPWVKALTDDFGRDVHLSGLAPNAEAREQAIGLIENIEGVRVVNAEGLQTVNAIAANGQTLNTATTQNTTNSANAGNTANASEQTTNSADASHAANANGQVANAANTSGQVATTTNTGVNAQATAPNSSNGNAAIAQNPTVENANGQAPASNTAVTDPNVASNAQTTNAQNPDSSVSPNNANASNIVTDLKAPTAEQLNCQQQLNQVMNSETINFATNRAILKPNSVALVKQLATITQKCEGVLGKAYIEIGGHTDNRGDKNYNLQLSQQRAEAVRQYMLKLGIANQYLKAQGYGDSQPVASNDSAADLAKNRRIEFKLKEQE